MDNNFKDLEPEYGRNVALIRKEGIRVVHGRGSREFRKELTQGVKLGAIGHLKEDRLKPEVFYHPALEKEAIECQMGEALHAIKCISQVLVMD